MENITHRLDIYLNDPFESTSIERLYEFSDVNNKLFGVPDGLEVLWFRVHSKHIQENDGFEQTKPSVLSAIRNPNQIIVFWASEIPMIPHEWSVIDKLNQFSESIPNPIIFFTGHIPTQSSDYKPLKFTISPSLFFEFESSTTWRKLPVVTNLTRSKKFMMMGTKDYPQRKFLLSHIIQNNLINNGYVSYKQIDRGTISGMYTPVQLQHIDTQSESINQYLPLPTLDNSIEYTKMPRQFMYDSYLNMVTDTYYDLEGTFISEKVFNAIAHQQMFLMLAPAHTLRHLQDIGYKTFGEYIDESYDSIENPYDRLLAVTNSFLTFVNQPIETIHEIYTKCKPILDHNLDRLNNNNYSQYVVRELYRAHYEKEQIK